MPVYRIQTLFERTQCPKDGGTNLKGWRQVAT
jgi:hypothetical protein